MGNESGIDSNFKQTTVNKTTEAAIASQIESADNIDVNLESDLSQLVQGKANSLKIAGEKIIVVKDIQLEKIDVTCQDFSLDLTQAILGKISFDRPGDFQVKLIFTESDCDRLLNTEYVRLLLQSLPLRISQQSANFHIEQAKCNLETEGKVSLVATAVLHRQQQIEKARFEISLQLYQDGLKLKFIEGRYLGDRTLDFDETVAMMDKVRDLLYLRHFANADLSLDITKIEVQSQQLIVRGNAQIKRIPDSITQSIESIASEVNDLGDRD